MNEKEAQKVFNRVIVASISSAGFDITKIDNRSLYQLEEDLRIGHYKYSGFIQERVGHVPLVASFQKRAKENIEILLKSRGTPKGFHSFGWRDKHCDSKFRRKS